MDEQIRKTFEAWWPEYEKKLRQIRIIVNKKSCADAFEQGWAEGIASMLDKADAKLSKMGKVRLGNKTIGEVLKLSIASKISNDGFFEPIGAILKKRREVKNDGKAGKNKS